MYCAVSKLNLDETIYKLDFSLGGISKKDREKLLEIIDDMPDKKILEDEIVVYNKAWPIRGILQRLKAFGVGYKVDPPYPYEIGEFREMTEDFLNEILEFSQKHQI